MLLLSELAIPLLALQCEAIALTLGATETKCSKDTAGHSELLVCQQLLYGNPVWQSDILPSCTCLLTLVAPVCICIAIPRHQNLLLMRGARLTHEPAHLLQPITMPLTKH